MTTLEPVVLLSFKVSLIVKVRLITSPALKADCPAGILLRVHELVAVGVGACPSTKKDC